MTVLSKMHHITNFIARPGEKALLTQAGLSGTLYYLFIFSICKETENNKAVFAGSRTPVSFDFLRIINLLG